MAMSIAKRSRPSRTPPSGNPAAAENRELSSLLPSELLSSIQQMIDKQTDHFRNSLGELEKCIHDKLKDLDHKFEELKKAVNFNAGETEELREEITQISEKAQAMKRDCNAELERLEVYVARENLVFLNVPEEPNVNGVEEVEKTLKKLYIEKLKLTPEQVENIEYQRAHRVPAKAHPRPIKARFLRFKDKMLIQQHSKALKGTNIFISDDFPRRVREARQEQLPALKAARRAGKRAFFSRTEPTKLFVDSVWMQQKDQRKFVEMMEREGNQNRAQPSTTSGAAQAAPRRGNQTGRGEAAAVRPKDTRKPLAMET